MSGLEPMTDTCLAAYGEPNPKRRSQLVEQVWNPQGQLVDPPLADEGHEEVVAMAARSALRNDFRES